MYPTFTDLQNICRRQDSAFQMMTSSLLTREGRLTKDMWKCTNKAFSEATDLEDALTRLSLIMDELVEKSSCSFYDRSYLRECVNNLRRWVIVHVDRSIWSEFPVITNPYAA